MPFIERDDRNQVRDNRRRHHLPGRGIDRADDRSRHSSRPADRGETAASASRRALPGIACCVHSCPRPSCGAPHPASRSASRRPSRDEGRRLPARGSARDRAVTARMSFSFDATTMPATPGAASDLLSSAAAGRAPARTAWPRHLGWRVKPRSALLDPRRRRLLRACPSRPGPSGLRVAGAGAGFSRWDAGAPTRRARGPLSFGRRARRARRPSAATCLCASCSAAAADGGERAGQIGGWRDCVASARRGRRQRQGAWPSADARSTARARASGARRGLPAPCLPAGRRVPGSARSRRGAFRLPRLHRRAAPGRTTRPAGQPAGRPQP